MGCMAMEKRMNGDIYNIETIIQEKAMKLFSFIWKNEWPKLDVGYNLKIEQEQSGIILRGTSDCHVIELDLTERADMFFQGLKSCSIEKWSEEYLNLLYLGGTMCFFHLEWDEMKVDTNGFNDYPHNFKTFIDYLESWGIPRSTIMQLEK